MWIRRSALAGLLAIGLAGLGPAGAWGRDLSDRESFEVRLAKAEQGDVQGLYEVGWHYHMGRGVAQDHAEAERYYRQAAEQGHAMAQHHLAVLYRNGNGVERDLEQSLHWERKSAAQGNELAKKQLQPLELKLAYDYQVGQGVPQDFQKAALLYQGPAEAGDATAQFNLGLLYLNGQGVERDLDLAEQWIGRSAEQGNASAKKTLAALQRGAYGAPAAAVTSPADAEGLRAGAERGDVAAMRDLGLAYRDGTGVETDAVQGVAWLRKAAEAGDPGAQAALGSAYDAGEGTEPDPAAAVAWFRRAAEQGHVGAQFNLGSMLVHGEGVPRDLPHGLMWLNLCRDRLHSARYLIFRLEAEVDPETLAEGRRLADEWRAAHAATGGSHATGAALD